MPDLPDNRLTLPFEEGLLHRETVFRCPPLTPQLVRAIELIAPHFRLDLQERSRFTWEKDQNGACWGEFDALQTVLCSLPRPQKILELGPGLGRSVVFFSKKLAWQRCEWHLFEGTGNSTRYAVLGPRSDESFCGNIPLLEDMLQFNGVSKVTIFDAARWKLRDLPGPYQLIYSFYAVGFHWAIQEFLDDLVELMDPNALAVFTVPPHFSWFPRLNEFVVQLIPFTPVWPKGAELKLLVLKRAVNDPLAVNRAPEIEKP